MKRKIMNVPASVRNLFNDMTQEERENYEANLGLLVHKHENKVADAYLPFLAAVKRHPLRSQKVQTLKKAWETAVKFLNIDAVKHEQWCYLMDEETLEKKYALIGKDVWYNGSLYHVKSLDYNGSLVLSLVSDEENYIEIVDDISQIVE